MVTASALQQFLLDYRFQLKQAADGPQDMPPLTEALFAKYEQTGSRLDYETVYFNRRKCLAVLGLQAVLEQEQGGGVPPERLSILASVIADVCGEVCWALPAHVDRQNDAQWPVTVDLFAAETAQTLAELSVRLDGQLPASIHGLIAAEAERRVFAPFLNAPAPYRNWEGSFNNWNAVCAGAIGSAALCLLRTQPERLNRCLERVCASLLNYIRGFAEDGTCLEGAAYYTYGMTYFVNFALELYEFTGGKTDLLRGEWGGFPAGQDGIRANIARFLPKCFFQDGTSVSFADATSQETFRVGLLCALSTRFPGVELPSLARAAGLHSDPCYRFAALRMDLFCTQQYLNSNRFQLSGTQNGTCATRFDILPAAQWCIGCAASGAGFACKGGNNGGSHNHNDIGHFIYEAGGVMLLTDLGMGEYTRDYYGPARYEILCASSLGHSVPIVRGEGQQAGVNFRCDSFSAWKDGTVEMELHNAYRSGLLERFVRRLEFDLKGGGLRVWDCFRLPSGSTTVFENLITQVPPERTNDGVILRSGSVAGLLRITLPSQANISIQTYSHRNHRGELEQSIRSSGQSPPGESLRKAGFLFVV